MDSNEYPKTLHQTADRHLVVLSADYTPNKTAFTHAEMTANGVKVVRFTMDFALNNRLTAAEMDALCKAWTTFRGEQRRAEDAEVARQIRVTKQAYALAKTCPAIDIVQSDEHSERMYVCIPDLEWGREANGADELLARVQEAERVLEESPISALEELA